MQAAHVDSAGASHGSLKTYLTGFFASVVLTVVPFWLVMHPAYSRTTIVSVIMALAVVQIVVHLVCFLHLSGKSEQRWNNIALVFTVLIVALVVVGTVWIMNSATANLMPVPDLTNQE